MSLTGKQKCHLLIQFLDEKADTVLASMSKKSADILASSLEDAPHLNTEETNTFLDSVLQEITRKQLEATTFDDPIEDEPLEDLESDIEEELLEIDETTDGGKGEHKEPAYPDTYRRPEDIAERLSEQQDQLIAFFLNHVQPPLREDIQSYLSEELVKRIAECKVESTPMSETIYNRLFETLVLKTEDENEEEDAYNDKSLLDEL
jgi:hypothetical protein